ncbi:lipopolysaccharide biosynthesis protein [Chryseobacterium indoltheticum]|uniref:Lipopolysaccharide biosynthesis protein wzxC n=1 Tax=Chryseobacterium indoltheticum TaxID=254 RepID=A0A381FPH9_9FLAO|nr:lipopolysaccharide biosynthesis protein [Chryseobacterium indoltheticum]SUX48407.1 Lipopolysaccharide biosynthesis protein wzxC [Chryseobacterium indoltheticum]
MSTLKKNFIIGFIWSFIGQISYLIIALVTNIILARILSPYEFGQVGIVMFFILISKVLTESGLTGALVRKKEVSEEDFSTVFVFNLVISVVLFIILLLFSGIIADFYNNKLLQNVLIALSSVLIINAFQFTQNAKIIRDLKFKKQSIYTLVSVIISSVIGIVLAFLKYGVWALVIMQISNAFILTLIYWVFEEPTKSFVFNKNSFKYLYKFGINTTFASMINSISDNIYNLILGKYFSIHYTGLYYQAKKLQEIPVGIVKSSTLGVVFSTLSKLQDNRVEFGRFYVRIATIFTTIVGLICLLVFFYAEQSILLLYGGKWIKAAFFVKILILASYFYMQEMLNRVLFKVFDKTDKILYLEIIKSVIQLISVIVGVILLDLKVLLYGFLITSIISYFFNYYFSRSIYGNFSWMEVITVLKVITIAIFLNYTLTKIAKILNLCGYELFYVLPFLIILYFILTKICHVVDIISETKIILKQIKKK